MRPSLNLVPVMNKKADSPTDETEFESYVGESAFLFITGTRFELGLIPAFDLGYNYSALRFWFDTFGSW